MHKMEIFILLFAISKIALAGATNQTMPEVPLPPAKYLYPSLVCGKPLPELSQEILDQIKVFYNGCISKSCNENGGERSDTFVYDISKILFQEPREFIKQYEDKNQGYTVLCSLFGKKDLEYVYCSYKMDANVDYQGSHCQNPEEEIPTPIFGSNKAAFSIEMQEMPAANVPSLKQLYSDNQDFLETTDVGGVVFHGRGRFKGLIQGPEKMRMLQNLNCENLTPSATETLEPIDTVLPSATNAFTTQLPPTDSSSVTTTVTQEISPSLSVTVSSSISTTETNEISPTDTKEISPSTSNTPSDFVSSSKTIPQPISNWLASSGMYNDTTSQPGRYQINNGVVTDTFTNLQWEQAHSNTTYNWTYANNTYCQSRITGGYTDWRLPAVLELQSLVDYTVPWKGSDPGINSTVFPNTPLVYFWSATPLVGGTPAQSWYVSFGRNSCYAGLVFSSKFPCGSFISSTYIRCTRAGQASVIANRYDTTTPEVVKDKKTGLIWEKRASTNNMQWHSAFTYCNGRTTGNASGWRLPTIKELSTLLDYSVTPEESLMDNTTFVGEPHGGYWSLSPVSGGTDDVWYVYFGNTLVYAYNVYYSRNVRCVCSSNCHPLPIANWNASTGIYADATNQTDRYKVEDGVVTDTFSNLQWEQANSASNMSWVNASDYCASQTTGGFTNWRVPTVLELHSLVDYKIDYHGPVINMTFFPNTPPSTFWSSTPLAGSTTQAWWVSFGTQDGDNWGGDNSRKPISTLYYVRCIRRGNNTITNRYDSTSLSGVVKDKLTGLWWEKSDSGTSSWNNLQSHCSSIHTGGLTWSPPTIKELLTIVDYKVPPGSLTMDAAFLGTSSPYWSSSAVSGDSAFAYRVYFNGGGVDYGGAMGGINYVRCVFGF